LYSRESSCQTEIKNIWVMILERGINVNIEFAYLTTTDLFSVLIKQEKFNIPVRTDYNSRR
jgi:hypothetical protein